MKIIHIRQLHGLSTILPGARVTSEFSLTVAKSQFMVAQFIKAHLEFPILVEGYLEPVSAPKRENIEVVRNTFPTGFPAEFAQLSASQDNLLYFNGAPSVLQHLGEIEEIHGTESLIIREFVERKLAAGQAEVLLMHREAEVINCAKAVAEKLFESLEDATIILVFGKSHDFAPYCQREGFELETIDTGDFSLDPKEAVALLDDKLAVLTTQLKQDPTVEANRGLFKWILKRKQALLAGDAVTELDGVPPTLKNQRLIDSTRKLASLSAEDSFSHRQLLAEVEVWQEKHPHFLIATVIKAIQAKDYSLALRRACNIGFYDPIEIICKYDIHLEINYQATSSNGNSPVKWVEQAEIDETIKAKITALLIRRRDKIVTDDPMVASGVAGTVASDSSSLVTDASNGQMFFKKKVVTDVPAAVIAADIMVLEHP